MSFRNEFAIRKFAPEQSRHVTGKFGDADSTADPVHEGLHTSLTAKGFTLAGRDGTKSRYTHPNGHVVKTSRSGTFEFHHANGIAMQGTGPAHLEKCLGTVN